MESVHRAAIRAPRPGILLPVVIAVAAIGCPQNTRPPEVPGARLPVEYLRVGDTRITAEIASTPAGRSRGLMFRDQIPEDHGMLFVYGREEVLTFWMKNTPIPLSIAFADTSGRILRIADMEPFSEELHSSLFPARYALEMRQGWFERNGVVAGDRISELPEAPVQ